MQPSKENALIQAVLQRLFIPLEASARHVHLTKEQALQLFGHDLTPQRPLSQPGQFLAQERVALHGPKGKLYHVAVLGPARKEAQVEISLTDGRALGITPPIRPSGEVADSPGILVAGELGTIALPQGVIAAQRHLHLTPETAALQGLSDGQIVRLQTLPNGHWFLRMCWCGCTPTMPMLPIWIMMKPMPAAWGQKIGGGSCHEAGTVDRPRPVPVGFFLCGTAAL